MSYAMLLLPLMFSNDYSAILLSLSTCHLYQLYTLQLHPEAEQICLKANVFVAMHALYDHTLLTVRQ